MSKLTRVELVDDLTGMPADETVRFGLDGKQFEIDLSADNAAQLRRELALYAQNGRRAGAKQRVRFTQSSQRSEPLT